MNSIQNIVSDLRDKRLLPVVAVLLIAAVAVPLLLMKGEKDEPTVKVRVTESPKLLGDSSLAQSSITVDEQFKKRKKLDAFKKKNPFVQQATGGAGEETGSGDVEPTESGDTSDSGSSGSGDAGGTSTTDSGSSKSSETTGKLYERTVTVRFGLLGSKFDTDDKVKKNLSALSPLPSSKNTLLIYMGVSANSPSAVFFVGRGVTVKGEGTCMPDKSNCTYLYLREKSNRNEATLYRRTEPDRKYGIKLKDIGLTEISETSSTSTQSKK